MVSTALWFSSLLAVGSSVEEAQKAGERGPLLGPIGLRASMDTSIGRGSFLGGPEARPYANLYWTLAPSVRLDRKGDLTARAQLGFSVNLVENADSTNTYPHQVQLDDLELRLRHADIARLPEAWLRWAGDLTVYLPTSHLSQLAGKILGLRAGLETTFAPLGWLSLGWTCRLTKNFNLADSEVLHDAAFDRGPVFRPSGPERVSAGVTATGRGVTSFALENGWDLTVTLPLRFSVLVDFTLLHAWSAVEDSFDSKSSAHAVGGRGRSDLMYGTIELGWEPIEELEFSLGTVVEQAPKTADNQSFRFPFWDTTNGAANRQMFYVGVALAL
jgi:hypothetical protein